MGIESDACYFHHYVQLNSHSKDMIDENDACIHDNVTSRSKDMLSDSGAEHPPDHTLHRVTNMVFLTP